MAAGRAAVLLGFAVAGGVGGAYGINQAVNFEQQAARANACEQAHYTSGTAQTDFCQETPYREGEVSTLKEGANIYRLLALGGVVISAFSTYAAYKTIDSRDPTTYTNHTIHHTYENPPQPPAGAEVATD